MKWLYFDLFLILFGGGIIFAAIGWDAPMWVARPAGLVLMLICGRLWYLSLTGRHLPPGDGL